jgi:hypothetical protein
MIKKLLLAALLLPLSSLAFAGDINPGDDNPGTTYITRDYTIGAILSGEGACSVETELCADGSYVLPPAEQLRGKKKAAAAMNEADGAAAIACAAAAVAESSWEWMYEGSGDLVIARHGNHGAVHRIKLVADLEAATMTGASTGAEASAYAEAEAWAFAGANSVAEKCAEILSAEYPGDLDPDLLNWCARATAIANANSSSNAWAEALASSQAMAASNSYAAASIDNEVWAANIEKYQTTLVTGAGSFAESNAEANAAAYASAYADAYAYAFAEACAGDQVDYLDFCDTDENTYSFYAEAYAEAFANARAEAMAGVEIEVTYPVLYRNENGIYDTIDFGPEELTDLGQPYATVSCAVNEVPE